MAAVGHDVYVIGGYNCKEQSQASFTFDGWVLHLSLLCERTPRQVVPCPSHLPLHVPHCMSCTSPKPPLPAVHGYLL